jgi:hypothetical protein
MPTWPDTWLRRCRCSELDRGRPAAHTLKFNASVGVPARRTKEMHMDSLYRRAGNALASAIVETRRNPGLRPYETFCEDLKAAKDVSQGEDAYRLALGTVEGLPKNPNYPYLPKLDARIGIEKLRQIVTAAQHLLARQDRSAAGLIP